jgi:hypothetical protein
MDEIEVNTELKKINALHPSLDESNGMTYIIFLESYRHRLNTAQVAWLDNKIDDITEKSRLAFETSMEHVDVDLAKKPIMEKMEETGVLREV